MPVEDKRDKGQTSAVLRLVSWKASIKNSRWFPRTAPFCSSLFCLISFPAFCGLFLHFFSPVFTPCFVYFDVHIFSTLMNKALCVEVFKDRTFFMRQYRFLSTYTSYFPRGLTFAGLVNSANVLNRIAIFRFVVKSIDSRFFLCRITSLRQNLVETS